VSFCCQESNHGSSVTQPHASLFSLIASPMLLKGQVLGTIYKQPHMPETQINFKIFYVPSIR